jgi:hypothetical protein
VLAHFHEQNRLVGASGTCDWSAIGCDLWIGLRAADPGGPPGAYFSCAPVPLYAAVYHDAVIAVGRGL